MRRRAFLTGFASLTGPFGLQAQEGEPWPRFRGPEGSGVGSGDGYPAEFGPTKNVIWKRALPMGKSSPVLTRERILLTGEENGDLTLFCLERATGKTVWKRVQSRSRQEFRHPLNHSCTPTPVTDGENVYAFFGDYGLVSYTLEGEDRWRTPVGPSTALWGTASSPVLAGDTIVMLSDGFGHSTLTGFHRHSGKKLWEVGRPPFALNYSTPLVRRAGERWEVLAVGPSGLVAYDAASGERLWNVDVGPGTIIASPIWGLENTVISMLFPTEAKAPFPDQNGDGLITDAEISKDPKNALTARVQRLIADESGDRDGKITEAEWNAFWRTLEGKPAIKATRIGAPRAATADCGTQWTYAKSIARVATPLLYEGVLYYVQMGGILTALRARTGEVAKVGRLEGALDNYYASPVAANGRLYFTSENGKVVVVAAGEGWRVLSVADFGEPCYATPALASGRVYLRTAQSLFCLGT